VVDTEWVIGTLQWPVMAGVVVSVILAGLVHGALGLGFPMVATPLIAVFLDVRVAILLTLLPTAAVNVASIWTAKPSVELLRRYAPLAMLTLAGAVVGALVLTVSSAEPFKLLLALLILLFLFTSQRGNWRRDWFVAYPSMAIAVTGLAGGFAAGTTNVMVAILIIYFLAMEIDRREMVPAMNLCFLVGKMSQIVVFAMAGLVDPQLVVMTLPLAAIALFALWLGQRVSSSIPQEKYRRILRYILALLAAILLLQFFQHVMR